MQNELREKLEEHIKKYGATGSFISRKVGVSKTTICLFRQNKRRLSDVIAEKLENYLNSFN